MSKPTASNAVTYRAKTMPPAQPLPTITRPHPRLLALYALRCLALCLLGPWFALAFIPLYFKFRTLHYRFDNEGFAVGWGLLWKRETYLTYARIQDIHVSTGLFERWLGLGTIHVQTAAGSVQAEATLPGLQAHNVIRDFLYSQMRGTLDQTQSVPTPPGAQRFSDPALILLQEILGEVRALRESATGASAEADEVVTPSKSDQSLP